MSDLTETVPSNVDLVFTPAARQAAIIRSASARLDAIGFSHSTSLPASIARIAHSPWSEFGSGT